jgi:acetyl/propionyl-CoA carboxylase alpha subunit
LREPSGPFIRVDSGIYEGYEVPIFYDPILSKVISFGRTREEARRRLIRALKEYIIFGIRTNIPYLIEVLESEAFISGKYTTNFAKNFDFVPQYPEYLVKLSALYEPPKRFHEGSPSRANVWKIFKDYSEF